MGSTRLPGKILKPFYKNYCILDIILENLQKVKDVKIIVATSISPDNDNLENYLLQKGILVYRGSEDDVLERFIRAAEMYKIDGIIRVCSDNPFIDYKGVNLLIEKAKKSNADYIGYRVNGMPSIRTHFGFWGEFVTLKSLCKVYGISDDLSEHEHVTSHIYTHPKDFNCEWIECPPFLQGRDDIRLTIDTEEDMENARKVYHYLRREYIYFGLEDVVAFLDSHSEYRSSMQKIIKQNNK